MEISDLKEWSRRDGKFLFLSALMWGFGMSLYRYIQPLYIASLGATPEQIGLVLGISGLVVVLVYIPIGLWADRHGRKPVMVAGWMLGALATFAIAAAPDWRWLIPAFSAFHMANFAMPAHRGYVAASSVGSNPSRAFAILSSGATLGSIVSPAIGGWIGETISLRAVYFSAGACFSLSTLMLLPLSKQPIKLPVTEHNPRKLLSNRKFLRHIAFVFILFFALEVGQVMVPNFLIDVRDLRLGQIGLLGTVGSLGIMLFGLVFGFMDSKRKGSLILSQIFALLALVLWIRETGVILIIAAYFLHGGYFVVLPVISGRIAKSLNESSYSFGFSLLESAMRLGLASAPFVAGILYTMDPIFPLYADVLCLCITVLLTFTLGSDSEAA